jgi:hypothetical protein
VRRPDGYILETVGRMTGVAREVALSLISASQGISPSTLAVPTLQRALLASGIDIGEAGARWAC